MDSTHICTACGQEVPPEEESCPNCGTWAGVVEREPGFGTEASFDVQETIETPLSDEAPTEILELPDGLPLELDEIPYLETSSPVITCPHCGQTHPPEARFCPSTGQHILLATPLCPQCGQRVTADWVRCPNCSNWLHPLRVTPATQTRPTPFVFILLGLFVVGLGIGFGIGLVWLSKQGYGPQAISVSVTFTPRLTPTSSPTPTYTPIPTLEAGATMISDVDGMVMVYIPAGEFLMGSADSDTYANDEEKPQHKVYLDAFWIDKTEVTNDMYMQCEKAGVCDRPDSTSSFTRSNYYTNSIYADYPVIYVSWNDAKTYCEWVNRRLPTEAEWEKAARGTDRRVYPWGNETPSHALHISYSGDTELVGGYPDGASPYGALDMIGNVYEWVSSLYEPYPYDPMDGREKNTSGTRVLRGGSWYIPLDRFLRAAYRFHNAPGVSAYHIGFRCARGAKQLSSTTSVTDVETTTIPMPEGLTPDITNTQAHEQMETPTPKPTKTSQLTNSPTPALGIGSTWTSPKDGMVMVYIPAGEFLMGSLDSDSGALSDEKPQHTVYLDAFWIDQTEVTNAMYALYRNSINNSDNPKAYVDWYQAQNYCAWAGRRLPTEAEWEKAARGTDGRLYPWGDSFDGTQANSCDSNCDWYWANMDFNDGFRDTAPVGSYPNGASPYGVLDMAGNVWEWVSDRYDEAYYTWSPYENPSGPSSGGNTYVVRGGSYNNDKNFLRTARRYGRNPNDIIWNVGFRCVMDAEQLQISPTTEGASAWIKLSEKPLRDLALSPDGRTLAVVSGKSLRLFNVDPWEEIWRVENERIFLGLDFHPDGMIIASGDQTGSVTLWDVISGNPLQTFLASSRVDELVFDPNGESLATGGEVSEFVEIWDVETGIKMGSLDVYDGVTFYDIGTGAGVIDMAQSPDGSSIALSLQSTFSVSIRSFTNDVIELGIGLSHETSSVAWSPDGESLAAGSLLVKMWLVDDSQLILELTRSDLPPLSSSSTEVASLAYSSDSRMIASGWTDGVLIVWDTESSEILKAYEGPVDGVVTLAWMPDKKEVVAGYYDGSIIFWEVGE